VRNPDRSRTVPRRAIAPGGSGSPYKSVRTCLAASLSGWSAFVSVAGFASVGFAGEARLATAPTVIAPRIRTVAAACFRAVEPCGSQQSTRQTGSLRRHHFSCFAGSEEDGGLDCCVRKLRGDHRRAQVL